MNVSYRNNFLKTPTPSKCPTLDSLMRGVCVCVFSKRGSHFHRTSFSLFHSYTFAKVTGLGKGREGEKQRDCIRTVAAGGGRDMFLRNSNCLNANSAEEDKWGSRCQKQHLAIMAPASLLLHRHSYSIGLQKRDRICFVMVQCCFCCFDENLQ